MKWTRLLVLAACLLFSVIAGSPIDEVGYWANSAFSQLEPDCQDCYLRKENFLVYIAPVSPYGRLRILTADGSGRRSGKHDSVLVLDPTPEKRFGHEIFMFFINSNHTEESCRKIRGVLLRNGNCMQQWMRDTCHKRAPKRRGSCKLLYLPEVRAEGSKKDSLECQNKLNGFSSKCPSLRHNLESSGCNPLETNSKSCDTTTYVKTDCAFMKTCDQAVLISGGWNRKMSDERSMKNIKSVNKMLLKNGFLQNNMRIFFANGLNKADEDKYEELGEVYPSGLKLAIRYHIRTLCETKRCVDSLVIYLNSPAMPDGSALLWDVDGDGVFDETEIYTVKELLRDIRGCKARRVIILADQSYCGEIVRVAGRHANSLSNVVILGVRVNDTRESLVDLISNKEPTTCLQELYEATHEVKFRGGDTEILNATLSGAPCNQDVDPERYFGCQNLSTLEMLEPDQTEDNEKR